MNNFITCHCREPLYNKLKDHRFEGYDRQYPECRCLPLQHWMIFIRILFRVIFQDFSKRFSTDPIRVFSGKNLNFLLISAIICTLLTEFPTFALQFEYISNASLPYSVPTRPKSSPTVRGRQQGI